MLPTSPLSAIRWLPLVNQSSFTIPAFACLRVVSTALDATGQLIYTVDQPNGDASANYLFNGPSAIAAGACGSGTLDFPCQATWDSGMPAAGDFWGPGSGQWTLTHGGLPGFPVLGVVDRGSGRMLIGSPTSPTAIIVKPAYDIAAIASTTPGSGSGEVYSFAGTNLSDLGQTVTVYNLSKQIAQAGTFYECVFVAGYAFIVNAGGAAMLFEATIYGTDLIATAATGEVTPTTAVWGSLPDPDTYPITVQNDFGLQGPIGRTCLVVQGDDGSYFLVQIKPPADVLFEGTLDTTLLATDASAVVVPVKSIYGGLPTAAMITAANDFQTSGSYGDLVLVAADILGNYYLIPTKSQPLPILFWTTLSANLATSDSTASCNAGVTQIYGTLAASAFTARNTLGLSGAANGPCLVAGDASVTDGAPTPNYYLLAVPPGGGCTFQLGTGDLAGGSASAEVGSKIWGTIPNHTGDTITVKDPQSLFARSLGSVSATAGALGEAVYDPVQGYLVMACDQETLKYKCTLTETLAYNGTATVGSLAAMNAKPFGQTRTAAISPANPLACAGPSGAAAYIEWNQTAGEWELTGVQNYKQTELTGVQMSGLNIQVKSRDAVGMFNAAETLFATIGTIPSTTITAVVGQSFAGGTLSYTTQPLTVFSGGTASAANTLFTTISLDPVTSLQYVGVSTHAFQSKGTPITAINPSYAATTSGTPDADWTSWATTVKGDPLTTVSLGGTGALTMTTTDMYLMEVGTPNLATSAGSLTTTTATVYTGLSYLGGLNYTTTTLTVLGTAEGGTGSIFSTTPTTVLTGGSYTYPYLSATVATIDAINPVSASAVNLLTATSVSAVTNVAWDGSNLKQTFTSVQLLGSTAGSTSTIDTTTPCPT